MKTFHLDAFVFAHEFDNEIKAGKFDIGTGEATLQVYEFARSFLERERNNLAAKHGGRSSEPEFLLMLARSLT